MRLFIAFEIPGEYSALISASQERIEAKASFPKYFHLTLKFIGEVEESKVDNLIKDLEQIRFNKFDAHFSGIGCFPDDRRPRVVWLALEPKDTLTKIADEIESTTKEFGIRQNKTFIPHITIARIKHIEDPKAFNDSLDSISIPTEPFTLTEFRLIKSTLTPEGPEYEVLKSFEQEN